MTARDRGPGDDLPVPEVLKILGANSWVPLAAGLALARFIGADLSGWGASRDRNAFPKPVGG